MSEQRSKFRVVLACADGDFARGVASRIKDSRQVEIVGMTEHGEEALRLCERTQAELIVLDTELSGADGLTVAFQLRERGSRQNILLISAFQGAQLLLMCKMLAVEYVLRKPIEVETLVDHLRLQAAAATVQAREQEGERALRQYLEGLFRAFELRTGAKSCRYTIEAVCACRSSNSGLTKEVYPEIARRFGTTPANVERSIRYLVQKIWHGGNTALLERYFGAERVRRGTHMTNHRFIQALLEGFAAENRSE